MLFLTLLHDLQELLQRDATVARDVSLCDDLIDIGLEGIKKYAKALVWAVKVLTLGNLYQRTQITDTGIKIK